MKKKTFLDGLPAEAREKVIAGAATGCENHDTDVLAFRIGDMLPRNTNTLTGTTSEQWDAERELYHVELTRRNVAAIEALEDRITKLEAETRGDFGVPANVAIRCLQDRVKTLEAQRAPQPSKSNEARDAAVMDYCNSKAEQHAKAQYGDITIKLTQAMRENEKLKAESEAIQKRHETYVRESEAVITDLRKRLGDQS